MKTHYLRAFSRFEYNIRGIIGRWRSAKDSAFFQYETIPQLRAISSEINCYDGRCLNCFQSNHTHRLAETLGWFNKDTNPTKLLIAFSNQLVCAFFLKGRKCFWNMVGFFGLVTTVKFGHTLNSELVLEILSEAGNNEKFVEKECMANFFLVLFLRRLEPP